MSALRNKQTKRSKLNPVFWPVNSHFSVLHRYYLSCVFPSIDRSEKKDWLEKLSRIYLEELTTMGVSTADAISVLHKVDRNLHSRKKET